MQSKNDPSSDSAMLKWSSAINNIYITLELQAHLSSLHETPVENRLSTHAIWLAHFPARVFSKTANEPWRVWNEREEQCMVSPWVYKNIQPWVVEPPPPQPSNEMSPPAADWRVDLKSERGIRGEGV